MIVALPGLFSYRVFKKKKKKKKMRFFFKILFLYHMYMDMTVEGA